MPDTNWKRVNRHLPCPVCGKPDWCVYTGPDTSPHTVICMRVEGGSTRQTDNGGFVHHLKEVGPACHNQGSRYAVLKQSDTDNRFLADASKQFAGAVTEEELSRLADELGVTSTSLRDLGVGRASRDDLAGVGTHCRSAACWSFPMHDGDGGVVGLHLRTETGEKFSAKGSRLGLFHPGAIAGSDLLIATEGMSDTAAVLSVGLESVGRPSALGGIENMVKLVKRSKPETVAVVADNDQPNSDGRSIGIEGARRLAGALAMYAPAVKVISPPAEIKDVRAWVRAGAGRDEIKQAINAAPAWGVRVSGRCCGRHNRK